VQVLEDEPQLDGRFVVTLLAAAEAEARDLADTARASRISVRETIGYNGAADQTSWVTVLDFPGEGQWATGAR
jgi:hypothetical protein